MSMNYEIDKQKDFSDCELRIVDLQTVSPPDVVEPSPCLKKTASFTV